MQINGGEEFEYLGLNSLAVKILNHIGDKEVNIELSTQERKEVMKDMNYYTYTFSAPKTGEYELIGPNGIGIRLHGREEVTTGN